MARFLTQRLISSFISIIGATLVIFLLVQLHNDPRELYVPDSGYGLTEEQWEMLGEKMGFNDPLPVQYWNWISGAFLGDFGVSLAQQVPVRDIIQNRINKFKEDNSLLTQDWVMDPKLKVKDVLNKVDSKNLKIKDFIRIKIGE